MTLCAACWGSGAGGTEGAGDEVEELGRVRALVVRAQADTVRFEAGAVARRCGAGGAPAGGLLLEGAVEGKGNGVLIWLRSGDPFAVGEYPLLPPRDTTTRRGAMVSVRYMTADIAHGFVLDSGAVAVTKAVRGRLSARAWGSGLEVGAGTRVALEAVFEDLPVAADTVSCRVRS